MISFAGLLRPLRTLPIHRDHPSSVRELTQRSFAALAAMTAVETNEVLASESKGVRIATLNRPNQLNALNATMVKRLRELYAKWEEDPRVNIVLLKGNGRAFCAGGDVRSVYSLGKAGHLSHCTDFFKLEYELNHSIATLRKPQVSLINGVCMGGGNGLAMHGPFRVATEHALFAMPETAIALHPDVGASYFLSRLPGYLGEFLGLTGTRLDGADMLACGLATHFVPAERLGMVEDRLSALGTGEGAAVDAALREHSEKPEVAEGSPIRRRHIIDQCFNKETVEEIVAALHDCAEEGEDWCRHPLKALSRGSPTSLKITLQSIRSGRRETLAQCLEREFRLTTRCCSALLSPDFYEGVRAVLVEKDMRPMWHPPTLEEVRGEMVEAFFAPLPQEEELALTGKRREGRARL